MIEFTTEEMQWLISQVENMPTKFGSNIYSLLSLKVKEFNKAQEAKNNEPKENTKEISN